VGTRNAEDSDPLSRSRERARVRARALRHTQTDAEALLWSKLRARQMLGLKIRRQHPVGDNEVLTQTRAVLEKIYQVAETLTPTLSRKRERE
jgi:very-short-patch-repair endonuclease